MEKCAEFLDTCSEGIQDQIDFSYRAENGLQQLLDSINSSLDGKEDDSEIITLKMELRNVLTKAHDYRNACITVAKRGSKTREINGIKRAIKRGDLDPLFQLVNDILHLFATCSQFLDTLHNECRNVRQKIGSAADRYEADRDSAQSGKKDSAIAIYAGAGAVVLGALLTPFIPPAGLALAGTGVATVAGGAIGIAVHAGRLDAARKALNRVESLSDDLENVKRKVAGVSTAMDECKDHIEAVGHSGERARKRERVSSAVRVRIEKSLNNMCSQFEDLIERHL